MKVRQASATERVHLQIAPSQPVIDMLTDWSDGTEQPIAATHAVMRAEDIELEI